MRRIESLEPRFVEYIPKTVEQGVLYVSTKFQTAVHLCCCGCSSKVVTPLKAGGWSLTVKRGAITLHPSIGSWSLPCQSHYWIRSNRIVWAPKFTHTQIERVRETDRLAREAYFNEQRERAPLWRRLVDWLKQLLR